MDGAAATAMAMEGATVIRRQRRQSTVQWGRDSNGRRYGDTTGTEGTTAMEGATAMDGALGAENGSNSGDIITEVV